jgi:hypothetical protein
MQSGRIHSYPVSKTAVIKAYYQDKTFNEALELSHGLDEQTAKVIWTACKRVEDFVYFGAADLRHETGLDRYTADFIHTKSTQKRRREKVEARKNEPKTYLTSKQYYHSL